MAIDLSVYFINRQISTLPEGLVPEPAIEDAAFAGQRYESRVLSHRTFRHCTFANISFKDTSIEECVFEDCVFVNCYFRKTKMKSTRFSASRFIECNFPKTALSACVFDFSFFDRCFIAPSEVVHNLPTYANLRRDLARNLAHEAEALGYPAEARTFRLWEIDANEDHLRYGWRHEGQWYQQHFPGLERIIAFFRWIGSKLNGLNRTGNPGGRIG